MGGCCVSKQSENITSSQRGGGVRRRRRRRHNNNNSNNNVTSFTDLSNSAQSGGGAGMTFSTSSKSGGTGTTGSSSGRTLTDEEGSYSSYSGSDDGSSRSGEEDLRVWFEREKKKVDAARMAEKERKEALAAQLGTHNQHWQGFGVGAGGPPLAGSPTSPNYTNNNNNNNSFNNRHDRETSNNSGGGGAGQSFPSYNTLGGGGNTSVSNPLQPNGIVDFPPYDAFDSRNPSLYSESQLRRHAGPSSTNGSNHSSHDAGSTTVVSGLQPNSFFMGSNSGSGRGSVHGNSLGANNSLFSQPQSGRLGSRVSESLDSQSSGRAGSLFQPSTLFGGSNRSGRQDSAQGSSLNTAATTTTTSSSVRSGNSDSLYSGGSGSGRKTSQGTAASSSFGRSSNATTPSPAHSQYSNQSSSHQQLPGAQTIMSNGEVFTYGGGRGDDGLDKSGSQAEKIFVQQSVVLPPRMDSSPFSSVRSSLVSNGGGGGGGGPSSADGSHGSNSGSGGGSNSSVGAVPIRPPRSPSEVSQPPVIVTHRKTSVSKTSSSLPSSPASARSGSQRFSVESSTSQQINIQLNSRSASEQRTTFSTASTASSDGTKIFSDESGSRDETMFRHKKNSVTNSLNTIGEFVNNDLEVGRQQQHGLVGIGSPEDGDFSAAGQNGSSATNGVNDGLGLPSLSANHTAGGVGSDDDDSFVQKQPRGVSGHVVTVARLRELSTGTGDSTDTCTITYNSTTRTEGEVSVASTGPLNNSAHIPTGKHANVSPPPASTARSPSSQDHSSANASLTSPNDQDHYLTAAGSSTTSSETPLPNRRTSRTNAARRGIPDADAETVAPDVRSISVGDLPSMDGSTTPNSGCASMTNSVISSNGSANLLSGGGAATTVQVTKGGHHHHHRAKFIHMMSSGDNSIDSKRSSGGGSSGDSKAGSGGPLEESSLHNGSSSTQCFE